MASPLRDFTRINPHTFDGYKVEEEPYEFIDEIYQILYAMGLSTCERLNKPHTNLRMWPKLGMSNGGTIVH